MRMQDTENHIISEHSHQHKELLKNISEMLMSAGKETRPIDSKLLVIAASGVFENTVANFLGKLRPWLQMIQNVCNF